MRRTSLLHQGIISLEYAGDTNTIEIANKGDEVAKLPDFKIEEEEEAEGPAKKNHFLSNLFTKKDPKPTDLRVFSENREPKDQNLSKSRSSSSSSSRSGAEEADKVVQEMGGLNKKRPS